jgi:hypothetical protein
MTPEERMELFRTFTMSVFRLETLQRYTVPQEAERLATFLAGRPLPKRDPTTHPWLRLIADTTAAGKRWYRVHVVDLPLSDYVRYELASYAETQAAGFETYIAERGAHPDLDGLRQDFWLFDDRLVLVMHYDDAGRPLESELAPEAELDAYLTRRDLALAHAVSLADYLNSEKRRSA